MVRVGSLFKIGGEFMNIVFLDFDGVVETIYWEKAKDGTWSYNVHKFGHEELNNKQAIGWLNELYKKVPYKVVVTSTWRYSMDIAQLQELLIKSGHALETLKDAGLAELV